MAKCPRSMVKQNCRYDHIPILWKKMLSYLCCNFYICVKHLLTEILCVIDENIKQENLNQSRDLVSDKPGYQKILHEFWVDQEFPKTNGSFLKMTIKQIICTFDTAFNCQRLLKDSSFSSSIFLLWDFSDSFLFFYSSIKCLFTQSGQWPHLTTLLHKKFSL